MLPKLTSCLTRRVGALSLASTATIALDRRFNQDTPDNTDAKPSKASQDWKERLANTHSLGGPTATKSFYNDWAKDYDNVLVQWGYNAHDMCIELLSTFLESNASQQNVERREISILDLGCGTGLVGQSLRDDPVNSSYAVTLHGVDISDASIELLQQTKPNIYDHCQTCDMNHPPLPFDDDAFDAIISSGVLTYCTNFEGLFSEWERVLKKDGIVVVSHRSDYMKNDKKHFEQLEASGNWKILHHSEPRPYLPGNENYGLSVMVEYFVARKL